MPLSSAPFDVPPLDSRASSVEWPALTRRRLAAADAASGRLSSRDDEPPHSRCNGDSLLGRDRACASLGSLDAIQTSFEVLAAMFKRDDRASSSSSPPIGGAACEPRRRVTGVAEPMPSSSSSLSGDFNEDGDARSATFSGDWVTRRLAAGAAASSTGLTERLTRFAALVASMAFGVGFRSAVTFEARLRRLFSRSTAFSRSRCDNDGDGAATVCELGVVRSRLLRRVPPSPVDFLAASFSVDLDFRFVDSS